MFTFVIIAAMCLSGAFTQPLSFGEREILEDVHGQQYYLVPVGDVHQRVRRASEVIVDHGSAGSSVAHKSTLINNENHQVDFTASAARNFNPKGPLTTGQQVDYTYKPTDSGFSFKTENTRGYGTDAAASANYNFFRTQDKQGSLGISGDYMRHFGGPGGTGRPEYGVFLRGTYNY